MNTITIPPKAVPKVKASYTEVDTGLAFSNLSRLALEYTVLSNVSTNPLFAAAYYFPMVASTVMQQWKAWNAIPKSATLAEKVLACPLLSLLNFHPIIQKVNAVASMIGVARNSLPKLATSVNNESLVGTAVHAFNLIAQGYFSKNSFIGIDPIKIAENELKFQWANRK